MNEIYSPATQHLIKAGLKKESIHPQTIGQEYVPLLVKYINEHQPKDRSKVIAIDNNTAIASEQFIRIEFDYDRARSYRYGYKAPFEVRHSPGRVVTRGHSCLYQPFWELNSDETHLLHWGVDDDLAALAQIHIGPPLICAAEALHLVHTFQFKLPEVRRLSLPVENDSPLIYYCTATELQKLCATPQTRQTKG
ncbi:hypothetical protein M1116_01600 [Patescibacteria group bacterium]|nr:hypothetical protein [Patescibacteria group bacterium]